MDDLGRLEDRPRGRSWTLGRLKRAPAGSIREPPEAPPVAPMVLAATSSGNGCSVTEEVQATLRASNDVHAALDRIPRAARSVANAVLLWNGRWIDANEVGGPGAIDPIRAAVAAVVHTASADCRTAQLTGPRFMIVPSPSGTRILTFGSGDWTWAEVAAG